MLRLIVSLAVGSVVAISASSAFALNNAPNCNGMPKSQFAQCIIDQAAGQR